MLAVPSIQKELRATLIRTKAKQPKVFLYSSSLEKAMGKENRMKVVTVARKSPIKISLEGIGPAIDALRRLIEMLTPIYRTMKKLEEERKRLEIKQLEKELEREEITIERERRKSFKEHLELLKFVEEMDIRDELKAYILHAVHSNMRSIELNPIKPMLPV